MLRAHIGGMKTAIFIASLLGCAFSLDAQITATLVRLPDNRDDVKIRNDSTISLVAFAVTIMRVPQGEATSSAPFVVFSDSLIEPAVKPLLSNEERVIISSHMALRTPRSPGRRFLDEPIVSAGFYADGTTTGDTALVTRLIARRSNMLLAVETSLETLLDAGKRNVPRDQLINEFRKMVDSVRRWYLPPEQQVGRALYQSIIGKLTNLPEGELGSPFPPATFVAQETATLNHQRVTLLESQPSLADATLISIR